MAEKMRKNCSFCDTAIDEIYRTKKVGCPSCYEVFKDEIRKMLIEIHGVSSHNENILNINEIDEMLYLKQRLARAIKEEDYEEAAILRDQIKKKEKSDEKTRR
ncbi:MAG: UvrB/UvrC motif-containing protein [Candidatus Coatesbacteria bacterium]|nr:UvrB/UvrC motif-containing protein [Candidatus Coatesbacteria bacterium]